MFFSLWNGWTAEYIMLEHRAVTEKAQAILSTLKKKTHANTKLN